MMKGNELVLCLTVCAVVWEVSAVVCAVVKCEISTVTEGCVNCSGIIDAQEFQDIFAVTSCVDLLKEDELLGWRVIAARWEIERNEIQQSDNSPPGRLDTVELMLANALHSGNEYMEKVELDRRLLGVLRWRNLNKVMTLLFLLHSYILSLLPSSEHNDHPVLLTQDRIFTTSAIFCLIYPVEMALRVHSTGGFSRFYNDKLFPHSVWSNVCQSLLTLVGLVFTVLYFTLEAKQSRICQAFMSIALWRIFFVTPSFAQLLYSLFHGLQANQPSPTFTNLHHSKDHSRPQ